MKPTEKDIQRAKEFVGNEANKKLDSQAFIYIKNGKTTLSTDELEYYLTQYVLHLEAAGIIKFTANRHNDQ